MLNYTVRHKVILKGSLEKYGKEFMIAGSTPAQCITGIAMQIPELSRDIYNGYFCVRHKKNDFAEELTEDGIKEYFTGSISQTIEVIPVIAGAGGSGGGGWTNILLGSIILVAGIALSVVTGGASAAGAIGYVGTTLLGTLASSVTAFGAALAFTGISQILAKQDEEEKDVETYGFSGAGNIAKQGVPVPLIYGRVGVGSNLVESANIAADYGTETNPMKMLYASTSSLKIVDLLGEGPIVGLVNGGMSVYLDEIPFQKNVESKTWTKSSYHFNTGANNTIATGFRGVNEVFSLGNELKKDVPQYATITNPNVDQVIINIRSGPIYLISDSGNRHEYAIGFEIHVSDINQTYKLELYKEGTTKVQKWQRVPVTDPITFEVRIEYQLVDTYELSVEKTSNLFVAGNTDAGFEVSITVDISHLERNSTRTIKVVRTSDNLPLTPGGGDSIYFLGYTEVTNVNVNYEGRAVVYLDVNAEDFQGNVPSRIYEVDGLIIDVPSNYNPETRHYSGIWDFTFKKAWTNNPVWVFYDLLTNGRYGLGRDIFPQHIDLSSLYLAAKYCDELVPDGFGGQEPRFTFNGVINSKETAYKVLQDVAGVFRSMIYAGAGTVFIAQDSPKQITRTFGRSNVIEGFFNYEGTGQKARHTAVAVTWINPDSLWKPEVEVYEDNELIIKYGLNTLDVTAVGCTSRGQAQRIARHALYSEHYETDTVSFSVGIADNDIRPGDIIYVADEMIQDARLFGRIKDITTEYVTLDFPVILQEGVGYVISLTSKDNEISEHSIIGGNEETDKLRFIAPISKELVDKLSSGCIWCLVTTTVKPRKYRVMSVTEKEDLTYAITALLHYDEKFALIDENISFDLPPISINPSGEILPPESFKATPYIYNIEGITKTGVKLSWTMPVDSRITGTQIKVKLPSDSSFRDFGSLASPTLTIEDVGVGTLEAHLTSYSDITKKKSVTVVYFADIISPYNTPPAPVNFQVESSNSIVTARWDKPQYPYDLTYEYYMSSPLGIENPSSTLATNVSFAKQYPSYPATVQVYVRSVNAVGMKSEYIRGIASVNVIHNEVEEWLGEIDKDWLTDELKQEIGINGTLNQIGESLLRATKQIWKVWTATETSLAFAVSGLTAKIDKNEEATASKFDAVGALYGEQIKSDDPDKFYLKWFDGSDPEYPETANPLYDDTQPISKDNYPYLPVYPSTSLAAQTMNVYAGKEIAKTEYVINLTNQLDDKFSSVVTELRSEIRENYATSEWVNTAIAKVDDKVAKVQENAVATVDSNGNKLINYSVKMETTALGPDGNDVQVIRGFGLDYNGSNAMFGVNADSFLIINPNVSEEAANVDKYAFYVDNTENRIFIGTRNTYFRGNIISYKFSLNDSNNSRGFFLSSEDGTFMFDGDSFRVNLDISGFMEWYKRDDNGNLNNSPIVTIGKRQIDNQTPEASIVVSPLDPNDGIVVRSYDGTISSISVPVIGETAGFTGKGGLYSFKDFSGSSTWDMVKDLLYGIDSIEDFKPHTTIGFDAPMIFRTRDYQVPTDWSSIAIEKANKIQEHNRRILTALKGMAAGAIKSLLYPFPLVYTYTVKATNYSYHRFYYRSVLWFKVYSGKETIRENTTITNRDYDLPPDILAEPLPLIGSNGAVLANYVDKRVGGWELLETTAPKDSSTFITNLVDI